MTYIAQQLRMSRHTVIRTIKQLIKIGYLSVARTPGKTTRYQVKYDNGTGDARSTTLVTPGALGSPTRSTTLVAYEALVTPETTDVSNIYNTSLRELFKQSKDKDIKAAAAAVVTGGATRVPPGLEKLIEEAKPFIQHSTEENYRSTIQRWEMLYPGVLRTVLEEIVLIRQSKPVMYWTRKLTAKQSEAMSRAETSEHSEETQRREFEQRLRQVADMRKAGEDEETIRKYLRKAQENYPLTAQELRERAEWGLICAA